MIKKINIFLKNSKGLYQYECSTDRCAKCKDAKQKYLKTVGWGLDFSQVKASFDKH